MIDKAKEKREFSIDNKIFTKEDILLLIKLFGKLSKDTDTSYSRLIFTYHDNTTISGTLEDILENNEILENKKIVEINYSLSERVSSNQFLIRIKHTESDSHSSSSYVSVEGQDRIWVNETTRLIEDFLSNCKSQSKIVSKLQIPIMVITIFMLGFFMFNLVKLFIKTNLSFPRIIDNMFSKHLISFLIVSFLIALAPAFFIKELLKKLFPRIEIQTGKNIHQIKKEKLKRVLIIVSIILIPAIISFLLRLLLH